MFKDLPNHYLSDNDIEKHTPAPWDIPTLQPDKTEISVSGPKTPKVALIPSRDVSYNEQRANAVLIAAAPEMFNTLKRLVAALEDTHHMDVVLVRAMQRDVADARSLLDRMRGSNEND